MKNLGDGFYPKLITMSERINMSPEDVLVVMVSESGLNPASGANSSNAVGLIQIVPKYLNQYGFKGSGKEFGSLTGEDQLPYIENLIKKLENYFGKPFDNAAQYYCGNLIPASLKLPGIKASDPNTVILDGNATSNQYGNLLSVEKEREYYKSNKGLDSDGDGKITFKDMQNRVANKRRDPNYLEAIKQLNLARSGQSSMSEESNTPNAGEHNIPDNFLEELMKLLETDLGSDIKLSSKTYGTIRVYAGDYTTTVEFARILSSAMDEFGLKSFIHTNGSSVDVDFNFLGNNIDLGKAAAKVLLNEVSEEFKEATKKLGSIEPKTYLFINKKSSLEEINCVAAESEYRKFLLKFASKEIK